MATREYACQLRFNRGSWESPKWKAVGKRIAVPIDLASTPSKMAALLSAIQASGRRLELIEQYELQVEDDNGIVFRALHATAEQLQWHYAGYPANVEDDSVPRALADFTDDQLLGELRRRLAARTDMVADRDAG
jgi:hypothetical protein